MPLAGHNCAISRHFAGISILKKNHAKTLHPSSIPWNPLCLSGFQREKGTISPFITLHLFTFSRKDLLPKSPLAQAVGYALNEYNAICDIFKRGDTALDNNYIERIQRYISLSRRNSLFFGSHEGARRGAILYSIAISCKQNGVNLFEYISDVIEKTVEWQPNTPLEKYRDLLPDRWKSSSSQLKICCYCFFIIQWYKRGAAY